MLSLGIGGVERNCLILGKGFKDRSIKNVIITNKTMRKELKNDFLDIAENVFLIRFKGKKYSKNSYFAKKI